MSSGLQLLKFLTFWLVFATTDTRYHWTTHLPFRRPRPTLYENLRLLPGSLRRIQWRATCDRSSNLPAIQCYYCNCTEDSWPIQDSCRHTECPIEQFLTYRTTRVITPPVCGTARTRWMTCQQCSCLYNQAFDCFGIICPLQSEYDRLNITFENALIKDNANWHDERDYIRHHHHLFHATNDGEEEANSMETSNAYIESDVSSNGIVTAESSSTSSYSSLGGDNNGTSTSKTNAGVGPGRDNNADTFKTNAGVGPGRDNNGDTSKTNNGVGPGRDNNADTFKTNAGVGSGRGNNEDTSKTNAGVGPGRDNNEDTSKTNAGVGSGRDNNADTFETNVGVGPGRDKNEDTSKTNAGVGSGRDNNADTFKTNAGVGPGGDINADTFKTNAGVGPGGDINADTFKTNAGVGPGGDNNADTFKTNVGVEPVERQYMPSGLISAGNDSNKSTPDTGSSLDGALSKLSTEADTNSEDDKETGDPAGDDVGSLTTEVTNEEGNTVHLSGWSGKCLSDDPQPIIQCANCICRRANDKECFDTACPYHLLQFVMHPKSKRNIDVNACYVNEMWFECRTCECHNGKVGKCDVLPSCPPLQNALDNVPIIEVISNTTTTVTPIHIQKRAEPFGSSTTQKEAKLDGDLFGQNALDNVPIIEVISHTTTTVTPIHIQKRAEPFGSTTTQKEAELDGDRFGQNALDNVPIIEVISNTTTTVTPIHIQKRAEPFGSSTTQKEAKLDGDLFGQNALDNVPIIEVISNTKTTVTPIHIQKRAEAFGTRTTLQREKLHGDLYGRRRRRVKARKYGLNGFYRDIAW